MRSSAKAIVDPNFHAQRRRYMQIADNLHNCRLPSDLTSRRRPALRTYDCLFIKGEWVPSTGTNVVDVTSPHSELVVGHAPEATSEDVIALSARPERHLTRASGRASNLREGRVPHRLGRCVRTHVDEMATLITEEMGSPASYSQFAQALPGVLIINAGVKLAARTPWEEVRRGDLADTVVRRTPVGVVQP